VLEVCGVVCEEKSHTAVNRTTIKGFVEYRLSSFLSVSERVTPDLFRSVVYKDDIEK